MYKYLNAWNKETIIISKFVIGMCFASLTMCTAGVIEVFRQKNCIGSRILSEEIKLFINFFEYFRQ